VNYNLGKNGLHESESREKGKLKTAERKINMETQNFETALWLCLLFDIQNYQG